MKQILLSPEEVYCIVLFRKPEDHWSYIAHLSPEDTFKSAVIEEKKFKHSPSAGADNPLGPTCLMSTGRLHHYGHLLKV